MTHVEENDALASQIINALPERSAGFSWWSRAWAPSLAMIAVVITAAIVWGTRETQQRAATASPLAAQPIAKVTPLMASVREAEPNRTMPLERLEPLEPLELPTMDFDRSLPAVGAPEALVMPSLAPEALEASEGLVLKPLAIADLPLTAESNPPR
ncbi:MAG: hypothetical protein K2Y23_16095 [Cyanobacteria bacterium]|nr:hypothetical protein [Cyanobacteriota bacterium]